MNSRSRLPVAPWLAAFLAAVPAAQAQQSPQVGYVYPAGGRQGTEFEVSVGGQYLNGVNDALVSGGGVRAMVVNHTKPLSRKQLNDLSKKLRELRALQQRKQAAAKKGKQMRLPDPAGEFKAAALALGLDLDLKEFTELRKKLTDPKRQPNPQIAEIATLHVTVAADAEPGEREIRLKTGAGVSNPLFFHVGQCQEHCENEPNDKTPDGRLPEFLPVIVNGQIMPGDVDRFRFFATKGTRLVAAVSAQSLIPYLADTVPGWFQATLTLSDASGNEVAYADDFRFHPDPVIYYEVPENGEYVLEIKDAIYRGREDFVYRIAVGEVPFVTGVFPLGGRAGGKTSVEVNGWNLPVAGLTLDAKGKGAGILPVSVRKNERVSNRVPFVLDTLPECLEKEPNNEPSSPQRVKLPVIVNGRIDRPGDWDVFCFEGRAGDEVVAEVQARRLGSPVDSLLKLTDAGGRQLAVNDDHEDKGAGLTTHHADSRLAIKLPKDGTYLLHLGDTQHKGGPAHAYRLRVGPRRPDFELRVVPSSISARAGMIVPITVYALRRDGFSDGIELRLKDAPRGFDLSGGWVPAGQDSVRLTMTTTQVPRKEPYKLRLEGRAAIDGQEALRTAVPAEDMMQAFMYRHLVPAKDWMVAVTGRRRYGPELKLLAEGPVMLPVGGTARVQLSAPKGPFMQEVRFELSEPPKGIGIKKVSPGPKGLAVLLSADDGDVKCGLKGNLIVNAFVERAVKSKDGKPTGRTRRTAIGTLPAIPFEVVAALPAKPDKP